MKNFEALNLLEASRLSFKDIDNYSFGMAVQDAEDQLEKTETLLNKIKEPADDYTEYTKELQILYRDNSLKNADGSPKIERIEGRERLVFDDIKKTVYLKAKAELDKKYLKAIKLQEEKNKKYEKMLLEETKFTPVKIDEKQMPRKILRPHLRVARKLLNIQRK